MPCAAIHAQILHLTNNRAQILSPAGVIGFCGRTEIATRSIFPFNVFLNLPFLRHAEELVGIDEMTHFVERTLSAITNFAAREISGYEFWGFQCAVLSTRIASPVASA
jgi:hypothetical protein